MGCPEIKPHVLIYYAADIICSSLEQMTLLETIRKEILEKATLTWGGPELFKEGALVAGEFGWSVDDYRHDVSTASFTTQARDAVAAELKV